MLPNVDNFFSLLLLPLFIACSRAHPRAYLLAYLRGYFLACLLAWMFACLLVCLLACLLISTFANYTSGWIHNTTLSNLKEDTLCVGHR